MKFFSLKPKDKKEDIKNYSTYKEALDYCFDNNNDINNIGIIGDYGTGKSTIIGTYVKNEIDEKEYDIINISLLTLEQDSTDSLVLLKNIIKQIVQNPKKTLEYNIMKFKRPSLNIKSFAIILGFILSIMTVFFSNKNFIESIPLINNVMTWGFPIEFFRIIKYFLLIMLFILFIVYSYPKLFSGFKLNKFNVTSTIKAEIEKSTETLANEEFDYLEYLIYLLKREKKNLVLIIEDIDRYENLKIFQQLREVNNLLNENDDGNHYKFIYAVGNSLFSEYSKNDKVDIRKVYQSDFKSKVTKFFDFVVNVTPVMDNQNSYEFIKKQFPHILEGKSISDEDLFMISQYITSPRILIDVVNDYQIMKDMYVDKKGIQDLKLLYFAILKSRFYNFYDLIHDIFIDFQEIARLYENKEEYQMFEENRRNDFLAYALLFLTGEEKQEYASIGLLSEVWNKVKSSPNFNVVKESWGGYPITSKAYNNRNNAYLSQFLDYLSEHQMEYLFSAEEYRNKKRSKSPSKYESISEILSLYYQADNSLILKIIKDVENNRFSDPNKPNFSIKEVLDIDYIQLGLCEGILDANDYNMYISSSYLEVNDAKFIKSFNLYDDDPDLFVLVLYDFDTILSKMKKEKIRELNGLNVYLLEWIYNNRLSCDKSTQLKINAINNPLFFRIFLEFDFKNGMDKLNFLLNNCTELIDKSAIEELMNWLDNNFDSVDTSIENILKEIPIKNTLSLIDTEFKESFYLALIEQSIANLSTVSTLRYLLNKVNNGYKILLNPTLKKYKGLILKNDNFDNTEWLETLNNHIGKFVPLLNDESKELVKKTYKLVDDIKVKEISTINDSDFIMFVYENNYYEFTLENIKFIRQQFEFGSIDEYSDYVDYSLNNMDCLISFIKLSEGIFLNISNKWDELLVFEWLRKGSEEDFEDTIQFINKNNHIVFPRLKDLELSFNKLSILAVKSDLYENTFENLLFIYNSIIDNDETQVSLITTILKGDTFSFDEIYLNVELFETNEELEWIFYEALFQNENIDIRLFEKYIESYDKKLENIKCVSSIEKSIILFNHDRVDYTFDNINLCEPAVLMHLFNEKRAEILSTMLDWDASQVIEVLNKLQNNEEKKVYISLLLNDKKISKNYSFDLVETHLESITHSILDKDFISETCYLLNELQFNKSEATKLISMFDAQKGQRTVSKDFSGIAKLLKEKRLVDIINNNNYDNITIKHRPLPK